MTQRSSTAQSLCECRTSDNHPHEGPTRLVTFDVNTQPSGHGSYTVPVTAKLCEAHAARFLNGHLNAWVAS